MGREAGLARDQGQERPGLPGKLNPSGFGAMTAIPDVRSGWRRKPGTLNGLTRDCRHRYQQEGKSSRNMFAVRKTRPSGTNQICLDTIPVSGSTRLIDTNDVMDATDLEPKRPRFNCGLSEHFGAFGRKTESYPRVNSVMIARVP